MKQDIVFANDICRQLDNIVATHAPQKVFVLTDDNTLRLCLPKLSDADCIKEADIINIPAGDAHKTIATTEIVWEKLTYGSATRHSLLICLGGGMVTDLGGFAAATFKRGIRFINLPTSLLAMVDASVGGKTGVNFGGLKNEVGTFCNSNATIISTAFLDTLDMRNMLSGYAEMIKHGLLSTDCHWAELLQFDIVQPQLATLQDMVQQSVAVKQRYADADPHEQGIRKALNFGHTIGHAIEELALQQDKELLHGYAVAYGMAAELYLSACLQHFPTNKLQQTMHFIRSHYGTPSFTCNDYPALLNLMRHDKKNISQQINFTLLADIGQPHINLSATDKDICEALDFAREA